MNTGIFSAVIDTVKAKINPFKLWIRIQQYTASRLVKNDSISPFLDFWFSKNSLTAVCRTV